jgi:hypothetical protein
LKSDGGLSEHEQSQWQSFDVLYNRGNLFSNNGDLHLKEGKRT